jgi:hypothetical protein
LYNILNPATRERPFIMTTDPTPADSASTNITEQAPAPAAAPPPTTEPAPTAAAIAKTPTTWPFKADMAILVCLLVLSFFLAAFTATNADLWMHLAIGKRISEGQFQFGVDPFSWATETPDGTPAVYWVHHSWLFSWLVFQLYTLAGGMGLVIGKAIAFTVAIALLCRIGWNEANRWFILICLLMAALAVSGRLFVQPMIVSYLFLAITLFVLARAGVFTLAHEETETPSSPAVARDVRALWWLPLMFVLWANLDGFFVLGLLAVGLCWAASGLAHRLGGESPVPGKTLGLVFGACVAACVVNPHHVRVFQLPPELAYVVLSITDTVHAPLPDELIAGGRALKEMQKAEPRAPWTTSAVSPTYWLEPRLGYNVAALAMAPLFLMGLTAFVLTGAVRAPGKAPVLHATRFLVWLVFGVLGLSLYRLLPFFALVAAPLAAMTLGEFLDWQQKINAVSIDKRERGMALARIVSLPVILLLLFLAWPGWLHGSSEYNSPRRVAFDIRLDDSVRQAAETLRDLQEKGECGNVFNGTQDLGNCLPWIAPGVKHAFDGRFTLFAGQIPRLAKARAALIESAANEEDWQPLFKERQIQQVVFTFPFQEGRIHKMWFAAEHWRQRYADPKSAIFSWRGPSETWPINTATQELERAAFGVVPANKRPPATGTKAPQALGFWTLYLEGTGSDVAAAGESAALGQYYTFPSKVQPIFGMMSFRPPKHPWVTPTVSAIAFSASLAAHPQAPALTIHPNLALLLHNFTFYRQRDFGPPGAPVIMMRLARQAVAKNPFDAASHAALLEANEMSRTHQEDYWIGYRRQSGAAHPSNLRDRLRHTLTLASAYHMMILQPENPDNHDRLAELYLQQNYIDLALHHCEEAYKGFERLTLEITDVKQREAVLKSYKDGKIAPLAQRVRLRLAKFKEMTEKDPPLIKAAKAIDGQAEEFVDGKESLVNLGLAQKAMEILESIDASTLKKEEAGPHLSFGLELRLRLGRAGEVAEFLKHPDNKEAVTSFAFVDKHLFAAGAVGDYESMEQALTMIEDQQRLVAKKVSEAVVIQRHAISVSFLTIPLQNHLPLVYHALDLPGDVYKNALTPTDHGVRGNVYNTMTLRGILALEAGETKQARDLFAAALKEAGDIHYPDRPIATRYLELLEAQKR